MLLANSLVQSRKVDPACRVWMALFQSSRRGIHAYTLGQCM